MSWKKKNIYIYIYILFLILISIFFKRILQFFELNETCMFRVLRIRSYHITCKFFKHNLWDFFFFLFFFQNNINLQTISLVSTFS